jgi:hypothetical protein
LGNQTITNAAKLQTNVLTHKGTINMTNATTTNSTKVHTSQENALATLTDGQRLVTANFRNPSRRAFIAVDASPWNQLAADNVPTQYRAILEAVLDNAAKSILAKYLTAYTMWPSELGAHLFNSAALLDEATGANSDWLTKEEIEAAWRDSATRKAYVTSPNYSNNQAYRKAVAYYEGLIVKLAGKTSQYKSEELDLIISKLRDEDLITELGGFIVRRVEAIKNRPQRETEINLDLL